MGSRSASVRKKILARTNPGRFVLADLLLASTACLPYAYAATCVQLISVGRPRCDDSPVTVLDHPPPSTVAQRTTSERIGGGDATGPRRKPRLNPGRFN